MPRQSLACAVAASLMTPFIRRNRLRNEFKSGGKDGCDQRPVEDAGSRRAWSCQAPSAAAPAQAAEYGLGTYLLGYSIPLIGYTPPAGFYYSSTFYLYSGSANANLGIPLGHQLELSIAYQVVTNISQFSWVTDLKALGGYDGFVALIPFWVGKDHRWRRSTDRWASIGRSTCPGSPIVHR